MPIQPVNFIQCQSDGWISVRRLDGVLLGAIPGTPPQEDFIQSPIGAIPVYAGVVYFIAPTDEQLTRLHELPGFVPTDEAGLDIAHHITQPSNNQSDIGEPI